MTILQHILQFQKISYEINKYWIKITETNAFGISDLYRYCAPSYTITVISPSIVLHWKSAS